MSQVRCPYCATAIDTAQLAVGQHSQCPYCRGPIVVPESHAASPQRAGAVTVAQPRVAPPPLPSLAPLPLSSVSSAVTHGRASRVQQSAYYLNNFLITLLCLVALAVVGWVGYSIFRETFHSESIRADPADTKTPPSTPEEKQPIVKREHHAVKKKEEGLADRQEVSVVPSARDKGMRLRKGSSAVDPTIGALKASIHEIVTTYGNEVAGDERFKGKKILITGRFAIWRYLVAQILIVDSQHSESYVRCHFATSRSQLDGGDILLEGSSVTIVGVCRGRGSFGGDVVQLDKCVVVTSDEELERLRQARRKREVDEALAREIKAEAEARKGPAWVFVPLGSAGFQDDEYGATRIVQVTGKLTDVGKTSYEVNEIVGWRRVIVLTIEVQEPQKRAEYIKCWFTDGDKMNGRHTKELAKLKTGQRVTVRGHRPIESFFAGLTLSDCVLTKE